ncbi:adenylate/guanylate cyclase domain-containing protein [Salegentibacter agarivorans]
MSLFNNYRKGIENVLGRKEDFISKGLNGPYALLNESRKTFSSVPSTIKPDAKTILEFDSSQLKKYFGPNSYSFDTISIGNHPDFKFLQENETIKHHCVSMFVDIKGSTRLQLKYSLEEVRIIKDTLLTLCINVVSHFGGHVHRLQGDAAFVQFVRKDHNPNDSIINALNAASVLCQAVSEDLSAAFESYGLDPIKIRVGIDYGADEQVMWSHYGISNCNELTTTSIHTDLAAKLQHKASINSIRIGKNLVDAIEMKEDYFSTPTQITDGLPQEDRYIIKSPELNYRQFDFQWKKYLKSFSFYQQKADGKLEIVENDFQLNASIYLPDEENFSTSYYENNSAIPKGNLIKYQLMYKGFEYHRKPQEGIIWEAYNSGAEAKAAKEEVHSFENFYVNRTYCIAHAGYHGNHYLKCTIQRDHSSNIVLKFPIYVDNKVKPLDSLSAEIRAELRRVNQ